MTELRPLGRLLDHDERSRAYPAATVPGPLRSVLWPRRAPIFDQGELGSCTGNAAAGWLGTDSDARRGRADVDEALAVEIYSRATHLDRIRGIYPPDDTGSSGLAVAKAMRALGLTTGSYRHAFGVEHALAALMLGPVLVGMEWRTGCDEPSPTGQVHYTGDVRGGHEVLLRGYNASFRLLTFDNSWGAEWADKGSFYMSAADFAAVLANQGDVTVPT
jgi:hypothetical protein